MEQEIVTISLSVQQWTQILNCLSLAPFSAVNQISESINSLQQQAAPQVESAAAKHAPAEADGVSVSE